MHSCNVCVLASVNKQVVDLSEELSRKAEDSVRQQEEISSLLAQIVDLQARCKGVSDTHTTSGIGRQRRPAIAVEYIHHLYVSTTFEFIFILSVVLAHP